MSDHRDDYYDLGSYQRVITTSSPEAQKWFSRGLIWMYGFNHEEAVVCFQRAAEADPRCTMAHWGVAYCIGPNYNRPWSVFSGQERAEVLHTARRAVAAASETSQDGHATAIESMLVPPLRHRYVGDANTRPAHSLEKYAGAMKEVYDKFPDDMEVATLYAESLMNLTPWALWDIRTGRPAEGARTLEIKTVIERGLQRKPDHPGLLHMYIHLMEMSPFPEGALNHADRLRRLVPDSGHLNHMPTHLDILCGDYRRAIESNTDAIVANDKFFAAKTRPPMFYTLYRCHDLHFRLYAAMFAGQSAVAFDTAQKIRDVVTKEVLLVKSPPLADWLESFVAMHLHVCVRFGRWEDLAGMEVMSSPRDQKLYCFTTALTYYGKGIALANLGRIAEAERNVRLFRSAAAQVPATRTLFNNTCQDILAIALEMMRGEVAYFDGAPDKAMSHFRAAIALETSLSYDEPWGWMQPARHAYGALLLEQGRVEEACRVYKEDLGFAPGVPRPVQHRNNVWALHGLHECLARLGKKDEAVLVKGPLDLALALADVPIGASCFCRKEPYTPPGSGGGCAGAGGTCRL